MDIHGYPRKNDMDMDMDMDGIFLIHGKPVLIITMVFVGYSCVCYEITIFSVCSTDGLWLVW